VYDRILKRMRESVRTGAYVMTLHAEEEMDDDDLTVFDIESAILTGRIVERQRGRSSVERKYLVRGETLAGDAAVIVARFGPTGSLVIITVYRD